MYLDYAGSAVATTTMLDHIHNELRKRVQTHQLTNPHTHIHEDDDYITECRRLLCQLVNTSLEEYTPIFTMNATHAIQLVGQLLPVNHFVYTKSNHNSVLGLRNVYKDSSITCVSFDPTRTSFTGTVLQNKTPTATSAVTTLIALPAECNFSGEYYSLEWIETLRSWFPCTNTLVLLDAAKYCATNHLDLTRWKPDFVPISLYKILGFPTGLGVLFIKNSIRHLLQKTYFGGGTLDVSIADRLVTIPKQDFISQVEDGTIPFITILQAKLALEYYFNYVQPSLFVVQQISDYAFDSAKQLVHTNGKKMLHVYRKDGLKYGSILTFNVINQDGEYIGYKDVERMAKQHKIILRTGCFCNPGACSEYLDIPSDDILTNYSKGHTCSNQQDVIDGKVTGALRISFGYGSTYNDVDTFFDWLKRVYGTTTSLLDASRYLGKQPRITSFILYPIKSCVGQSVESWVLNTSGFVFDRMFAIYDEQGKMVSLQRNIRLGLIKPEIKLEERILYIHFEDDCFVVNIDTFENQNNSLVNTWLSNALQQKVMLVKQTERNRNFSNTSPFLVLNEESLLDLNLRIMNKHTILSKLPDFFSWKSIAVKQPWLHEQIKAERFRPNIIIKDLMPYEEDTITLINVKNKDITFVSERQCSRCYTTTMNTEKQSRDPNLEPMTTLLTYRKKKDGVMFGGLFFLDVKSEGMTVSIHDEIEIAFQSESNKQSFNLTSTNKHSTMLIEMYVLEDAIQENNLAKTRQILDLLLSLESHTDEPILKTWFEDCCNKARSKDIIKLVFWYCLQSKNNARRGQEQDERRNKIEWWLDVLLKFSHYTFKNEPGFSSYQKFTCIFELGVLFDLPLLNEHQKSVIQETKQVVFRTNQQFRAYPFFALVEKLLGRVSDVSAIRSCINVLREKYNEYLACISPSQIEEFIFERIRNQEIGVALYIMDEFDVCRDGVMNKHIMRHLQKMNILMEKDIVYNSKLRKWFTIARNLQQYPKLQLQVNYMHCIRDQMLIILRQTVPLSSSIIEHILHPYVDINYDDDFQSKGGDYDEDSSLTSSSSFSHSRIDLDSDEESEQEEIEEEIDDEELNLSDDDDFPERQVQNDTTTTILENEYKVEAEIVRTFFA